MNRTSAPSVPLSCFSMISARLRPAWRAAFWGGLVLGSVPVMAQPGATTPSSVPMSVTAPLPSPAPASEEASVPERLRWSLGASVGSSPDYPGSADRSYGVRPIIGLRWKNVTLSTGGGGSLLNYDLERSGSGLSASLWDGSDLRLNAGLRLDSGRSAEENNLLRHLPEVRRTLRGRLALVYDFAPGWSARSAWSQDLLGRGGGARWDNTLRYEHRLTPDTTLTFAGAINLANGTYMRSYYGVPAGTASALALYRPGGGLHDTSVGVDLRMNLNAHWVLTAGIDHVQLRGDARRSPLTQKPNYFTAGIGLAYRCCR